MDKFSLKMRASQQEQHISGAERILNEAELIDATSSLMSRALTHEKGEADFIQIKMEKKESEEILRFSALPVKTMETKSVIEGYETMKQLLSQLSIQNPDKILGFLPKTYGMRGAMLLHVDSLERFEENQLRGVRATYMDSTDFTASKKQSKNHFQEALILATKVAHCPHILGELCISDDPNYITGYVASRDLGYVRITTVKEMGSGNGGRIFLFRGGQEEAKETLEFLEKQWVLVENLPDSPISVEKTDETWNKWDRYEKEMELWEQSGLKRVEKVVIPSKEKGSSWVTYGEKQLIMMASNNYLGLTQHPNLIKAGQKALEEYGTGSGGSRLTTGTSDIHDDLEKNLAMWKGTESAMVFTSGFVANFSILACLLQVEDVVFSDSLNHASLIDGCRFSSANVVVYKHNDMEDLKAKIQKYQGKSGMIVTDAVFSMDGDIANIPELQEIARKNHLLFYVDEAHSTGVLGKTGKGICEHFNLKEKPDLLMGTLSKALGSEGGFLCGNSCIINYLKHKARGYMFSTALAPATVATAKSAIELLEKDVSLVVKLQENVAYFNELLKNKGINAVSPTPIFPILIGEEEKSVKIAEKLQESGYFVSPIRYPTVEKGKARLRVVLMAQHEKTDLETFVDLLGDCMGLK